MRQGIQGRLKSYGAHHKSYGCCSLFGGVLTWSIYSLFLGVLLVACVTLLDWKTQDLVHVSFEVQQTVRSRLHFGSKDSTVDQPAAAVEGEPVKSSHHYDEQIKILDQQLQQFFEQFDIWIKRILWMYGVLCLIRGMFGILGLGMKDPHMIKLLWFLTIASFAIDEILCTIIPINLILHHIYLKWYIWLYLLIPLIYLPYVGWITSEKIYSYYRILEMGEAGIDFTSPHDLEALLLPDKFPQIDECIIEEPSF